MKSIKLTQQAYIDGYDGAFYRFNNADGSESPCGIWDKWYTASAIDDAGNEYSVVWEITDEESFKNGDEEYVCEWTQPTYIKDSDGKNVTDDVTLVW